MDALFLHGLAGHAGEWEPTIRAVGGRAYDGLGHGSAERYPHDVSPDAHVADALRHIAEPVLLVGQSLGGRTAIALAARHIELVRGLVVIETGLEATSAEDCREVGDRLRGWPAPFPDLATARAYYAAAPYEKREDGWWPAFDPDVLERILTSILAGPLHDEWGTITVPKLAIRGEHGEVDVPAPSVTIPAAGHDVHLDAPEAWCAVLSEFRSSLDGP